MKEYVIRPEAHYSKLYPVFMTTFLFAAVAFSFMGHFVTAVGYILTGIFLFCALYYGVLFFYYKYYQVRVCPNALTVCNIKNTHKTYNIDTIRWRIIRIPWYNTYFINIYSTTQKPVAIVRPHWKNATRILKLAHFGKLTPVEKQYIEFMKNVGLL